MAIEIISGIRSYSREALDKRSGPYISLAAALAALPVEQRYVGLRVIVVANATFDAGGNFITGTVSEYRFETGIADVNLVEITSGAGGVSDGVLTSAVIDVNGDLILSFSEGLPDITVDMSAVGGVSTRTVSDVPPAQLPTIPGEEYVVISSTIYTV